ncbi:glycoside hydrolase superfamily [Obelidium mucronatum]|nr:glycoside hydrolase superfamily [Obelidium mucronatum]
MSYELQEVKLDNDAAIRGEVAQTNAPANRKKYIVIGSAVLILALAGGLGAYFLTRKSDSSSASSSSGSSAKPSASGALPPVITGPVSNIPKIPSKLIGYWGQNAVNNQLDLVKGWGLRPLSATENQRPLGWYCDTKLYDTINLSFLSEFGGGDNHFTINFAANGLYKWDGTKQTSGYDSMEKVGLDIVKCQAAGVKIMMSLGGDKISSYKFAKGDGKRYAELFYNAFLGGPSTAVKPFGANVVLDGIELDVEKNPSDDTPGADPTAWTPEMVDFVKTIKQLSPKSLLAAVPQCSLAVPGYLGKDRNMGDLLAQVPELFDYVIVQYYNNIECTYPFGFNYKSWKGLFGGYIFIGLPGDWTSAISGGFLEPNSLQAVYDSIKADNQFAGFSVYDVSSSNPPGKSRNAANANAASLPDSRYSETIKNLLNNQIVGSGMPAPGAPLIETDFAYRCGGSWVHANATCSNKVCNPYAGPVTGCGPTEQCFRFLATKC